MGRLDRDDRGGRSRGGGDFEYKKRDAASTRKRAEQRGGMFDGIFKEGVKRYTAPTGDNIIRILPPTWEDAEHYGYDVWSHYGIGADKSTYLCLKKMKGKECPICEAAAEMKAEGEEKAAKRIEAKRQVAVYMIDRDEKRPELQIWTMPWGVDKDIALNSENKKTGEILAIDDPKKGYDVFFRREGKELATRYNGVNIDRDPSPLSDDRKEMAEWLADIQENPIPSLLKFYNAEYLQKVVDGHSSASTEDEDDDDRGGKRLKRRGRDDDDDDEADTRRSRGRGRDSDSDSDDDDGGRRNRGRRDSEDDDDDDRAVRGRGRSREDEDDDEAPRKRRARDEDEDDDDRVSRKTRRSRDEDEDDDEAPRKRTRSRDDDDEDEGDRPRKRRADPADDDDADEDRPRKRRAAEDDDDGEDERPRRRSRDSEDDDEDERPRKRR